MVPLGPAGPPTGSALHELWWPVLGLPAGSAVFVATSQEILQRGFTSLFPSDASGATGLLVAALAWHFAVEPESIRLIRPQGTRSLFRRPRPGRATIKESRRAGLWKRPPRTNDEHHPGAHDAWVSLSRSHDLVAVAFSNRRIGVDVESVQTFDQSRDLLSLLHPGDRLEIERNAQARLRLDTTAAWTRIEAVSKLRGTGLNMDPARIRVGHSQTLALRGLKVNTSGADGLGHPVPLPYTDNGVSDASLASIVSVAWRSR